MCVICRQREVEKVRVESQKTQEMCRSSVGALREGLLSLEERLAVSRMEVREREREQDVFVFPQESVVFECIAVSFH